MPLSVSSRFVLLASGLGLGSSHADSMLGLQLLIDMVTGQLGDQGEQSGAATISRVLLAGNLLSQSTQDKDAATKVASTALNLTHIYLHSVSLLLVLLFQKRGWTFTEIPVLPSLCVKPKYLTKKTQAGSVEAIRLLDELLLQLVVSLTHRIETRLIIHNKWLNSWSWKSFLAPNWVVMTTEKVSLCHCLLLFQASLPVDVMPGQFDPTNYTLPQQPLHRCMFPLSSVYPTLQLSSNPYIANIDGVRWAAPYTVTIFLASSLSKCVDPGACLFVIPQRFLGTSGQNVSDIQKYSSMDSHLEILEETLRLRHLAPTAPDTLG